MKTQASSTLSKGLRLLRAIAADDGRHSLTHIATTLHIPLATAHRLTLSLTDEGFIVPLRKGHFAIGSGYLPLAPTEKSILAQASSYVRGPLARLARRHRGIGHFGHLDDGMVTYLVKEIGTDSPLFTQEQSQQEAYCSAIGKVLLAALSTDDVDAYLADGPFVALTPQTITQPDDIRRELALVRKRGFALDKQEIRDDLFCVGVPMLDPSNRVLGGLSLSFVEQKPDARTIILVRRALMRLSHQCQQSLK